MQFQYEYIYLDLTVGERCILWILKSALINIFFSISNHLKYICHVKMVVSSNKPTENYHLTEQFLSAPPSILSSFSFLFWFEQIYCFIQLIGFFNLLFFSKKKSLQMDKVRHDTYKMKMELKVE